MTHNDLLENDSIQKKIESALALVQPKTASFEDLELANDFLPFVADHVVNDKSSFRVLTQIERIAQEEDERVHLQNEWSCRILFLLLQ